MFVYEAPDYRKGILVLFQRRRELDPKLNYARISESAKMQPAYFSNVLKGRGDFNSDQLFLICTALKAESGETHFLLLLLEWSRSQVAARRGELKEKIEAIRRENAQTHKHIAATPVALSSMLEAEYYLDPFIQVIHVCLAMPAYAKNIGRLREALGLSREKLESSIRVLEKLQFISAVSAGGYQVLVKHRHLPQSSPICLPHQTLMRLKSAEQMSRLPAENRYHVSVTFSSKREVREQIRNHFLQFLKKAEAAVKNSSEEEVCQMNFDLFPWSLD